MKLIQRNKDLVNLSKKLEHLHTFKNFPVFMGSTSSNKSYDKKTDMIWMIGKKTGMIQLKKLIPEKILYSQSHNSGAIGKLWNEHHNQLAIFICKYKLNNILELGGGHGNLSQIILKKKKNKLNYTIIDANPNKKFKNIKYIKGFFNKKFLKKNNNFDTVIFSHFLEHVFDINLFLYQLSKLKKNTNIFISIPNMKEMILRNYVNCLNFEHTYYLDEKFLKYFLYKNDFKIIKKIKFKTDHSLFYLIRREDDMRKNNIINYYDYNKKIFKNYVYKNKKDVLNINEKIKKNKNIFVFGAHVFTQFILSIGLNTKNIKFILDNDKSKQKKRLYGTNLTIEAPDIIKDLIKPIVILRAGVYNAEIRKQLTNINKTVRII